jgi:putative transposase
MKFKTIKHINEPGCFHELTFSCCHNQTYFIHEEDFKLFIEASGDARERHGFKLLAFVIMPDHVHLLVYPAEGIYPISKILSGIKLSFSMRISKISREKYGKTQGHFWQRGGGYDRNIMSKKAIESSIDYIHENPVKRGLVDMAQDWPWSSAGYYAGRSDYSLRMDHELLEGLV